MSDKSVGTDICVVFILCFFHVPNEGVDAGTDEILDNIINKTRGNITQQDKNLKVREIVVVDTVQVS